MAISDSIKLGSTLLQLSIVVILFKYINCDEKCQSGLLMPGYTIPSGDILVEYGNPLDIICVLNDDYVQEHGINSSRQLFFEKDNKPLPNEMVEVIDSYRAKLHVDLPEKSNSVYTCNLNDEQIVVCLNTVVVGVKPQPVEDFQCIGYNYENLTCTWTAPENYAKTNYNLTYSFPGYRANRLQEFSCPKLEYKPREHKYSCLWSIFTNPEYRQAQRTYHFTITMTNDLGVNYVNKTFSHFQHVLSGPPENLTVISTTTESIYLHWSVPNSMQTFPPGVQHRILYQSELDAKQWKFGALFTTKEEKEAYFNVTGLKYAHMLYDVRVSLRSSAAVPDDESMWSRNASITVRTMSKEPGAPPKTTSGSFEVIPTRADADVFIYWQQIPQEIQNGEGFTYDVKLIGHSDDNIFVEQKNAYAKFSHLSLLKDYKFLIWSKNRVGKSQNYSVVTIPNSHQKVGEPLSFTKTEYGNGKYELNWDPQKGQDPIVNYTIFWCTHDRDRPYQCAGYLDWVIIPGNLTSYNITVPDAEVHPKIHQFAISANTLVSSSGMTWAACTVLSNTSLGKMKNININHIGSNFIEVGWKLDCSDRIGNVEGFIINYCPIVSPTERNCKGSQRNVTIPGKINVVTGRVPKLKPYTTYMLTVVVITKHNVLSQPSDPVFNTTLEAAPNTPPLYVKIMEVTNSSITVSWQSPAEMNGVLRYYELHYGNRSVRIDAPSETKYTLTNLTSYMYYDISVIACTVSCSPPSPIESVRTEVGYPGKIQQPSVIFQNDSYIVVNWKSPLQPRGKNDLYEVQFKEKLEDMNRTLPIINVTSTQYPIKYCGDDGKYNTFYISVRAVNIINNARYEGPWSDELESYCRRPPAKVLFWLLLVFCVVVLVMIFFGAKKAYIICHKMCDVEVKLPPGLAPVVAPDIDLNRHWVSEKAKDEDNQTHLPPSDEEVLLQTLTGDRNSLEDTSGCGSGNESVTSSADTSTRIPSPTDSGTVQFQTSSMEEIDKTNALRFRNPYISMPEGSNQWQSKTNPSANNYSVLGVDLDCSLSSDSTVVAEDISCPEVIELLHTAPFTNVHTPYALTGDLNNPLIQGYDSPNSSTIVEDENFTYVMAGSKPNAKPELIKLNSVNSTPIDDSADEDKNFTYVMAGSNPSAVSELIRLSSTSPIDSEEQQMYVQLADVSKTILDSSPQSSEWPQPSCSFGTNKLSYVSIGDIPPPITDNVKSECNSSTDFESKCFKED